ncbi:ABC transporter permease [Bacillus paranthracis]|uniref:ABC transporter permease n=1 Tax=Bacillus paranthracis TaxID=2026186 RepID=A0AAJ1K4E3_9BACI|nr:MULTISPECIES: ABC transporter permease [Bacillus]ADY24001.1 ABC transporter permease [Bacillus thuringiensis serovar finitimus YBT-020]MCW4575441.1 ABC transporter permease [Bacillus pacificus]MDA1584994.1 ABC transporter permease [Bacillus cereus group sp. TH230-1LC]MRC74619.1 FtsX-like permease family protein [Bacillus thuringiensis]OTX72098.1 ABC transporter permease [Bacillus thuringiensis serovar finitimus]
MTFWQFAFKNVSRNARAYFAYFVSSAFSIAIFFSFAVYLFHPKLHMTDVNYALNILMTISEVVIVFFSFFFLLYSIGTFLKVRKKQFGILTVLGISQKQLKRLIFIENMLIGVLSIFFGIQLGLVFSQFFLLVTAKITHVPGLYLYWPTSAIILTIIIFLGLFILVSSFTPMLIRTRKAVRLLKEGTKQKERKASVLISLFGATCLISGYALAANPLYFLSLGDIIGLLYAVSSIFVIPSLIAAGTYFFFSQISFLLIRILKARRTFYMKRINMLWISDLASRIRTNINMLFIVAMLSTLAFTMITFLYGFGKFTKFDAIRENPFPFTYLSHTENTLADEHLNWLEQKFNEEHFTYTKFKTDIYEVSSAENNTQLYYAIKQSDYNVLAKALNWEKLTVNKNESYILMKDLDDQVIGTLHNKEQKNTLTLTQNNLQLHVKEYKSYSPFPNSLIYQLLILSDENVEALSTVSKQMSVYNFKVTDWEKAHNIGSSFITKIHNDNAAIQAEHPPFHASEASDSLYKTKLNVASFFLIGTFLGVIFFIGAGSVLYFRMYTDLTNEQEKYITITKIGLTETEMKRSATIQLAILFFVPYIMASIHTMFATKMLQEVLHLSFFAEITVVLMIFGTVEILFFLLIRSFYMQKLSQHIKF